MSACHAPLSMAANVHLNAYRQFRITKKIEYDKIYFLTFVQRR